MRRRIFIALAAAAVLLGAGWLFLLRELPPLNLPPIERIVVHKSERRMELFSGGRLVHTLTGLQLGDAPIGHKQFEGDEKTPEGRYTIDLRNPRSRYHLSLRISYPDAAAQAYAATKQRSPGGEIFIHGQPGALPRPHAGRLDRRLHRPLQPRDRSTVGSGAGRHADRDFALA